MGNGCQRIAQTPDSQSAVSGTPVEHQELVGERTAFFVRWLRKWHFKTHTPVGVLVPTQSLTRAQQPTGGRKWETWCQTSRVMSSKQKFKTTKLIKKKAHPVFSTRASQLLYSFICLAQREDAGYIMFCKQADGQQQAPGPETRGRALQITFPFSLCL